jgi:hypothetical protein
MFICKFNIILLYIHGLLCQSSIYEHSLEIVSPEVYMLYWNFSDTNITAEIHVKTTGWVSLGITNKGSISNSDLFVAWVSSSGTTFIDSHFKGRNNIFTNEPQNWQLLDSYESRGVTMIKFTRLINLQTIDPEHDIDIKEGTPYISYAWGLVDPTTYINYLYSNRGTRPVPLISSIKRTSKLLETLIPTTFITFNKTLPNDRREYFYCQQFSLNETIARHITKVS